MAPKKKRVGGGVRRPALTRIEIKGFKSIVEQSIELGALNVLIGANGSGKTAVLEAIGVLGAAADGRVDDVGLLRRGVRPGVPKLYKNAFADLSRLPRFIKLRAESTADDYYSVSLDNPRDSPASPWRFSSEALGLGARNVLTRRSRSRGSKLPKLDPFVGLSRVATVTPKTRALINVLRGFMIFDPQTSVLRGTQPDLHQSDPIGPGGGRLAEALAMIEGSARGERLLEEFVAFVDWTSKVSVARPSPELLSPSIPVTSQIIRFKDRYMRPGADELSAYDASEGALYVMFALLLVLHPRTPRFFAIENIGHALHPRLARSLVSRLGELAIEEKRQIILTTHSPLVLDGLEIADDRIRLFTVERTAGGHTKIDRVTHSDALARALESGLTMSQMWARGLLGAVPAL